jgi:hypothetical protein
VGEMKKILVLTVLGVLIWDFLGRVDGTIVSDDLVLLPDQSKIFYDLQFIDNANASEVPEPAAMLLIGSGLLSVFGDSGRSL